MTNGTEWLVDAQGCDPSPLRDLDALKGVCARIVADLRLKVVGEPLWHRFPGPGGVTGMYLLTESHLTCHTFPEFGSATFNLYCCNPRPEWNWQTQLHAALGAEHVTVRRVRRGVAGAVLIPSHADEDAP